MNGNKFIVKTTKNSQKVEVGLRHPKDSILVMMKGNEYIMESTGVVQKAEVGLSHQHMSNIQANIKSVMNNLHGPASIQDSHPNVIDIELQNGGNQGNVKQIMMDKMTNLKKCFVHLIDIEVQMGHVMHSPVKVQNIVM